MERVFICNKKIVGTEEQWLAIDNAVRDIVSADTKKDVISIGLYSKSVSDGTLWKNSYIYIELAAGCDIPKSVFKAMNEIEEKTEGKTEGRVSVSVEYSDEAFPEDSVTLWRR